MPKNSFKSRKVTIFYCLIILLTLAEKAESAFRYQRLSKNLAGTLFTIFDDQVDLSCESKICMNGGICINLEALFQVGRGLDQSAMRGYSDSCACEKGYYGDNCEHETELLLSESEQLKRRHLKSREASRIRAKRKESLRGKQRKARSTAVTDELEMDLDLEFDYSGDKGEAKFENHRGFRESQEFSFGDYILSQIVFIGICVAGFMVALKSVEKSLKMAMNNTRT